MSSDDPENPLIDPLGWRAVKALSLDEMEAIASDAYRRLPDGFRTLCEGVIIRVDDFPSADVVK
jgi:predicted Zn-dependent protease with MMP-like domain